MFTAAVSCQRDVEHSRRISRAKSLLNLFEPRTGTHGETPYGDVWRFMLRRGLRQVRLGFARSSLSASGRDVHECPNSGGRHKRE